jgi:hypothetical protein
MKQLLRSTKLKKDAVLLGGDRTTLEREPKPFEFKLPAETQI